MLAHKADLKSQAGSRGGGGANPIFPVRGLGSGPAPHLSGLRGTACGFIPQVYVLYWVGTGLQGLPERRLKPSEHPHTHMLTCEHTAAAHTHAHSPARPEPDACVFQV